jgi:S-ribosylhomocysteine lyase LuxS involved in autoinducer biosynthesis
MIGRDGSLVPVNTHFGSMTGMYIQTESDPNDQKIANVQMTALLPLVQTSKELLPQNGNNFQLNK